MVAFSDLLVAEARPTEWGASESKTWVKQCIRVFLKLTAMFVGRGSGRSSA